MFYGQRIHDKCYRRAHFDAGEFVQSWDGGAPQRLLPVRIGCGPTTYNACSSTRWNDGVSLPIQSGHGCLGCAENGLWDEDRLRRVVVYSANGYSFHRRYRRFNRAWRGGSGCWCARRRQRRYQRRRHNQQPTETEHQPGDQDNRHEHSYETRDTPSIMPDAAWWSTRTRIEGHMRCEVNLDDQNVITNAVSSSTMFAGWRWSARARPTRCVGVVERSAASSPALAVASVWAVGAAVGVECRAPSDAVCDLSGDALVAMISGALLSACRDRLDRCVRCAESRPAENLPNWRKVSPLGRIIPWLFLRRTKPPEKIC